MATIDILPLNINGVKPPLNLLSNILAPITTGYKNLMYPLDLASNPNYGHAVQFTVYNYVYGIENTVQNVISGNALNLSMANPTQLKMQAQGDILSTITLYMPDTLNMDYNISYAGSSLEESLGVGKYFAGALADMDAANKGSAQDRSNFVNLYAKGAGVGLAALANKDLASLFGQALKTVPNPQLQLLFKGVELRTFQFTFTFTPVSSQEATQVDQIIQAFQYYAAPSLLGLSQQFMAPPQIFKINFAFTGGSGVAGAVTNFFKNIGTNILTSQVSGALFGSNQVDAKSNPAKIYNIYHPCVLKDIHVDYAPNGWAAYGDGHPVQTSLTLTFQETDIVTKEDINAAQASADAAGAAVQKQINQMQNQAWQSEVNAATPNSLPSQLSSTFSSSAILGSNSILNSNQ